MKTDERQKLLVILTLALLGVLVGERAVYNPLRAAWSSRAARIAALRKDVADGRLLLQRESSLRARWSGMQTNTLPGNASAAEQRLLKAVDGWAQESGVSINAVTPQWKDDATNYLALDCQVDASGGLGAACRLLHDVEKGPMGIKLESVELTARDNTGREMALGLRFSGLVLTPDGHP